MEQLTDWFPVDMKPIHIGFYQTKFEPYFVMIGYSLWNGKEWGYQYGSPSFSFLPVRKFPNSNPCQNKIWRGLSNKPE